MERAYATLTAKAVEAEDARLIEGIASTPTPDRMDDVVEPMGAEFKTPMALLWQHRADEPVGWVEWAKPNKQGIPFKARLAKIAEAGPLKDMVDKAWQAVKAGLVRGVSIGFRPKERSIIENGGYRFTRWEWMELSLVTIPANAEATITAIKSIDAELLAASGRGQESGDNNPSRRLGAVKAIPRGQQKMATPIAERISAFEATRAAKTARINEIQEKASSESRTKDEAEREETDTLKAEIKSLDAELVDLHELDKINRTSLKAVDGATQQAGSGSRGGEGGAPAYGTAVRVNQPKLDKGIGFTRLISVLAEAQGNRSEAADIAKGRWGDASGDLVAILKTPKDLIVKTAVNPGTTTDTTWAAPLVQYTNLASEFIEYLRPATIMGRIQGMRRVPFKVKVPRQTAGATVNWVGEGKVKPLTSIAFDSITLDHAKAAGIIPLTEELVRLSNPSAEMLVRDDLAASIGQFLDIEFIDISNASSDVSPASVTYGVTPVVATGTTASAFRTDAATMLDSLVSANLPMGSGVWIMTPTQAMRLGMMVNATGGYEFPGITVNGGSLLGFPVITTTNLNASTASPADGYPITFLVASEVLLADEGGVTVDISRDATVQMETAPDSPFTASTTLVSLWQHNMVGIRVERMINWTKRRSTIAGVISQAKYAE